MSLYFNWFNIKEIVIGWRKTLSSDWWKRILIYKKITIFCLLSLGMGDKIKTEIFIMEREKYCWVWHKWRKYWEIKWNLNENDPFRNVIDWFIQLFLFNINNETFPHTYVQFFNYISHIFQFMHCAIFFSCPAREF